MSEESDAKPLVASEAERFFAKEARGRFWARHRFGILVVAALLVHAAIIAALLYRDSKANLEVAAIEETPVEIVVEKPEPPKPPPPPPPEQQKPPEPPKPPKEEIEKPAFSAPRAPSETKVETNRTDEKTRAPKAPTPPSEGQPQPSQQASKPDEKETQPDTKEDASAKPEENKPDAEALDKAKPKVAPTPTTKQAKQAPKTKKKVPDALASLSGASDLPDFTFAKPTPKSPVYGGTEDVRYLAILEGLIMRRVHELPRLNHYQEGGTVAIAFHIDESGKVISVGIAQTSGYPDIDHMALDAVRNSSPFPPPPRGVPHGLIWGSNVAGQLPVHVMR